MRPAALACTGDPLLDELLGECASFALVGQPDCERAATPCRSSPRSARL